MPEREKAPRHDSREFPFIPRIINPVKIKNAVFFSADEHVRSAHKTLVENMPWISTEFFSDPMSVSTHSPGQPTVFIFDDTATNIVDTEQIRRNNKDVVLVLLTSNDFIQCSPPSVAREKFPYSAKTDLVFAYNSSDCAPDMIITSVVRAAEDLLNITKHSKARRFIFLIVDDEPRWFSQFLPVLYSIIGQRADVKLARTSEESLKFVFGVEGESEIDEKDFRRHGHGRDVVCLITDIFFPKGNEMNGTAGKDLIRLTRKYYPRIPIVTASKTKEADAFRDITFVLPKGDPGSLEILRKQIRDHTGIGDFIILDDQGEELHRVNNINEMLAVLDQAENDTEEAAELRKILESYGEKDNFSTWLYMHSYRELADELRPKREQGRRMITVLKRYLKRETLRMDRTPLIIDGVKIFKLPELLELFRSVDPSIIQRYSDNDVFSSWLDRKGYTVLADELRPIHGTGAALAKTLSEIVEKWMSKHQAGNLG